MFKYNKLRITEQHNQTILTILTTTTDESMKNSYLNHTVKILQQNDSYYTDKQCDKCMSLEGRTEN